MNVNEHMKNTNVCLYFSSYVSNHSIYNFKNSLEVNMLTKLVVNVKIIRALYLENYKDIHL